MEENNDLALKITQNLIDGNLRNSIDEKNDLLKNLGYLQTSLNQSLKEEEKRKNENYIRTWTSEGMAKFSSILGEHYDDIEYLSYKIIKELVKYLGANQGGFFIKEHGASGEKNLKMLSCYAYNRRKFADKRILWNDGLLGATAMEMKPLYIEDIPDNYLEITSGLGRSNPRFLLILPLVANDDTKGIIEIASFSGLKKYQLDFAEQLSKIIAKSMEDMIIRDETERLLEESRSKTKELAAREEETRKQMERLTAEHEQAAAQAEKFISFSSTVNHTLIRAEFDVKGILLYANTKFIRKLGYKANKDVEGKHISAFIDKKDHEWFNDYWESLAQGGAHFEGYMKHVARDGQDLWTMATYTCMRDEDGKVEKILFIAIDTTEQRKQSLDYESQMRALERLNVKAEFTPDGKVTNANKLFLNTFKYPEKELMGKTVYDFLDRRDIENFGDSWEQMIKGLPIQSQTRMITKFGEEKWFRASFTSVNDMYGEVSKVIFLGNEITNEKIMESENREQNEFLKKQEEKFRLDNLTLKRKIEEVSVKFQKEKEDFEFMMTSLKKMIDFSNDISIIFDSSGEIIYMNKASTVFFGINAKSRPGNTLQLISSLPENRKSDLLETILDPVKSRKIPKGIVLNKPDGNKQEFNLKFYDREWKSRKVYLLSLQTK